MPNENIIGGYYGDPTVYYGPSSYRAEGASVWGGAERGVFSEHPLYGPAKADALRSLPSPKAFFTSPAGITVVLLLAGFLAWKEVFG